MQENNQDFMTVLLKYGILFALIFAIIFLLAVLTPWMARQVDKLIARIKEKEPPKEEEDPRCAQVKGIYDMPIEKSETAETDITDTQGDEI